MAIGIDVVLGKLASVSESANGWQAKCPAHADNHPSLSIAKGQNGGILLKCHAGCRFAEIIGALGLNAEDLAPSQTPTIVAVYDYHQANGKRLFQKVRYAPKRFVQRRPDGNGGWIWNLKGIEPVLYHLPELIEAIQADKTIFLVEGEKDVDRLRGLGRMATCNPEGAAKPNQRPKWRAAYTEALVGAAKVVLVPDNDDPGRAHMRTIGAELIKAGAAREVRWLELPGLPAKGDVSDWLTTGGTVEALDDLVAAAPLYALDSEQTEKPRGGILTLTAEALQMKEFPEPMWAIPNLVPAGLTILAGRPKQGKSWLALGLGVAIACGGKAFSTQSVERGEVLYLALEDTERRFQQRMRTIMSPGKRWPRQLHLATEWKRAHEGGLEGLEQWATDYPEARLMIIDTLAKFRPHHRVKTDLYEHDYRSLTTIKDLADRCGIAIIVVHHLRKAVSDTDPLDDISGSTGIAGAADAILLLRRSRGQADATLLATGRDFEESDLALQWDSATCTWHALGQAEEYKHTRERLEVINILKQEGPLSIAEVANLIDKGYGYTKRHLWRMAKNGLIQTIKDKPLRYSACGGTFGTTGTLGISGTGGTKPLKEGKVPVVNPLVEPSETQQPRAFSAEGSTGSRGSTRSTQSLKHGEVKAGKVPVVEPLVEPSKPWASINSAHLWWEYRLKDSGVFLLHKFERPMSYEEARVELNMLCNGKLAEHRPKQA